MSGDRGRPERPRRGRELARRLVLLGGLLLLPALARPQPLEIVPGRPDQDAVHVALKQAQDLMRAGRLQPAIALLEPMHTTFPEDGRVTETLADGYLRAGQYSRAIELYQQEAARRGRDLNLWLKLSRAWQLAGRGREAIEVLLDCTRREPLDALVLSDQFELLAADSVVGAEALQRLEAAVREPQAAGAWKEALAHVYAGRGEGRAALELMMELERQKPSAGRSILDLARLSARRGDPQAALAAFDSVLILAPDSGNAEESWFEKARLLRELGRADEALATYAEQERRFPQGPLAARAALTRAEILMHEIGDWEGACQAYAALLERTSLPMQRKAQQALRDEARFALAECALRRADFDDATRRLSDLEATGAQSATRERAAYELGELLFYQGEFEQAEQAFYRLTDQYPNGDWVNDALERALLLGESAGADTALQTYARVQYQRRVGNRERALAECRGSRAVTPALQAAFLAEEMHLLAELDRWAEADSALTHLLVVAGAGRTAPAALLWLAERSEPKAERRALAEAYYEKLVLQYPDSPGARRARARLQVLRAAGVHS